MREPERLPGFIIGIARNLSRAYLRNPHIRGIAIDEDGDIRDNAPDQYDHVLGQEIAIIVRQALNSLKSPRDREVLRRLYIDEDDKEQICSDLGLTNGQFNLVLHRAKKQYEKLYRKLLTKMQRK